MLDAEPERFVRARLLRPRRCHDPRQAPRRTVTVCYESIQDVQNRAPKNTSSAGVNRHETIMGPVAQVFPHETGHTLFHLLGVPVLGREEAPPTNSPPPDPAAPETRPGAADHQGQRFPLRELRRGGDAGEGGSRGLFEQRIYTQGDAALLHAIEQPLLHPGTCPANDDLSSAPPGPQLLGNGTPLRPVPMSQEDRRDRAPKLLGRCLGLRATGLDQQLQLTPLRVRQHHASSLENEETPDFAIRSGNDRP